MAEYKEDFADLLGRYLSRAGLTQQELATEIGMHRNTVVKWMNRTAPHPRSPGQVLRIADALSLLKEERKALLQVANFPVEHWPTEVWTVPQHRDMFFTGRDAIFEALRTLLVPGSTTALIQAISGLGGVGKTHTAIEYAYRFHQDYEAILWLQADSWKSLVPGCIQLAEELALPEQKEADQTVVEIQRWLRQHRNWLLILDNVEQPQEMLGKFVPTLHQGCVLVTTRIHTFEPFAQTQVLPVMSDQEGMLFLLRRTKRIAPHAGLEQASQVQRDEARQIWELVEGLPLALDQAGAYIVKTGRSFLAYREQYSHRRMELLSTRGKPFLGHEASVETTFSLAFERIETLNPVAADILRACSLLYTEDIPEELFQEGAEHLGPRLAAEKEHWDLALALLQDYSLVQRNLEKKTFTLHRLVQAVLQDVLPEKEQEEWAKRTVLAINSVFPKQILRVDVGIWKQCERVLPQIRASEQLIKDYNLALPESANLLNRAALYIYHAVPALYLEAEQFYRHSIDIYTNLFGTEHPDTIEETENLAILYETRGKYKEAESLYKSVLELKKKTLGDDHRATAMCIHNLAELYRRQAKYKEAEDYFQQAIFLKENLVAAQPEYDELNISLAFDLQGLAYMFYELGKYGQAEPLVRRALAIRMRFLGSAHPGTATCYNLLALLDEEKGEFAEAESLLLSVKDIQESYHPQKDHHDVGIAYTNLGRFYTVQGKYQQAEQFFDEALRIYEETLGSDHPWTAICLSRFGFLLLKQKKYKKAEQFFQRALAISEKSLGPDNIYTATSLFNLGLLKSAQQNYTQAEEFFKRTLAIREKDLGLSHPNTREVVREYAALFRATGRGEEADQLEAAYSE